MAKQRMINTRFWNDDYISHLDPVEKLLFLYFLTNPATTICGIYELPLKNIALDTGLDKEMVEKIIKRFSEKSKTYYFEGWVYLPNFIKHQNQKSPTVKKGIEIELSLIPSRIKKFIASLGYGMDTLSHLNLNINLNSNPKVLPSEAKDFAQNQETKAMSKVPLEFKNGKLVKSDKINL